MQLLSRMSGQDIELLSLYENGANAQQISNQGAMWYQMQVLISGLSCKQDIDLIFLSCTF